MQFEKIKTVPTAEEILDRSLRRVAAKLRQKRKTDRANEEFIRAVASAVHDRLVHIIQDFPILEELPPFYKDLVEILFGINRFRKALGAVGWAAWQSKLVGSNLGRSVRFSEESRKVRKQAVARISSIVYQIDDHLRFLNEARNTLRKLPDIHEEFTIVVAGYPNVGKSSFIRLVSSAEPEVAVYPFTTKRIILGHRKVGRQYIQLIDTPGLFFRPDQDERNKIERQAMSALINVADVILFLLDASESCGFLLSDQMSLLEQLKQVLNIPILVAVNKADRQPLEGYVNMSTTTGEGVEEVLDLLLKYRGASPTNLRSHSRQENQE